MKRYVSPFSLYLIGFTLVAAACGGAGDGAAGGTAAPTDGEQPRVTLVVNGVLGDKSFFDSAQRGMDQAEAELGLETTTIELGIDPANWQSGLEDAAADTDSYDILITGTFQMAEFLAAVAPQYPDKQFILFDVSVDYEACPCENVYSVLYKQNEGSYLAGLYGAAMSQNTELEGINPESAIGVIGGQDIPVINDFVVGYEQGAVQVDPASNVIIQYAGGWNDPAKGKELTLAMYQQGADIVFNVAGGTGQGIFEAALEEGLWAIGVDSDQALIFEESNPDMAARVLTSMLKNVDNSLFRALDLHLQGQLPYGSAENLGIAEGGVGLAKNKYYDQYTPDDVKATIDEAEQQILDGEIQVDTVF